MNDPAAVTTPSERTCLDAVHRITGAKGGPLEAHSLRVARIACELARRSGAAVDSELILCAGLLHDIGLYPEASHGGVYTAEGAEFARRTLPSEDWPEPRMTLLADAIERHHELRPQWKRGTEVELLRRADLVEVSGRLIRFGIERSWFAALDAELPRKGFYREIGRLLGRAARERPATLPKIFLR